LSSTGAFGGSAVDADEGAADGDASDDAELEGDPEGLLGVRRRHDVVVERRTRSIAVNAPAKISRRRSLKSIEVSES